MNVPVRLVNRLGFVTDCCAVWELHHATSTRSPVSLILPQQIHPQPTEASRATVALVMSLLPCEAC